MAVVFSKLDNSTALVDWVRDSNDLQNQNPLTLLDALYALHPEGYLFDPRYIRRRFTKYDGKVHLFKIFNDMNPNNRIPLGLVKDAINLLRAFGWTVTFTEDLKNSFVDRFDYDAHINSFTNAIKNATGMTPRDYQEKILKLSLNKKRSCFRAATGAGKSLAIYMIVRFYMKMFKDQRFLILVPNIGLVNQLHQNFRDDYKWADVDKFVGTYHSEYNLAHRREALQKQVVISTWQSMNSIIKGDSSLNYFKLFSTLIVDELHTAKKESSAINNVIRACVNADRRFGLTGTIPRNELDIKTLIGNFGEIEQIISTRELIERGELSKALIYEVRVPYDTYSVQLCRKKKVDIKTEMELIHKTESTQYAVSQLIRTGVITNEQNTLILLNRVKNGEIDSMIAHLNANHPEFQTEKVHGGISMDVREGIRLGIEGRKGVIIVATYKTFGTGINMKNLHNVIFASSTKSYTSILQSIGRSLRLHSSKEFARVFDINHYLHEVYRTSRSKEDKIYNSHITKHYVEQREIFYYEEEYPLETIMVDKEFTFKGLNIADEVEQYEDSELQ